MSGICGSTDDSQRTRVAGMNAAMAARAPDFERTYTDFFSGVSLSARRASVVDVAGGRQPVGNEDGTVWAALNGEIYDHPMLREQLRGRGHRFASDVDTELLVHLYEEHGAGMVHVLEGMYAFALWDARRQELLLVRDRFGEKPLFFSEQGAELMFASELDALLAGINHEPELDPASVDAFFVFGYVPGPASIVRGVQQLPPGHLLRWERRSRRLQVESYWTPAASVEPGSREGFDELVAETGRLLELSVRSRLMADVPFGVLLSGGRGSALIAALAARASERPVRTFTVGYESGAASKTAHAHRVAQELGTEHHELVLTDEQLVGLVTALLAGTDQPLADEALIPLHAAAEQAQRDVTLALAGDGANELFGGHRRYRWLWRSEQPHPPFEGHLDWVTAGRRALRERLYGPALHGRVSEDMVLGELHWLPDDVLVKTDRAGTRVSLEVRTPYLHREVAEFAGTVPERMHLMDGGKALLRAVLAQLAPEAARRHREADFRVPTADWLRGPLAPLIDSQLADGTAFAEGWFDRAEAVSLVAEHRDETRDRSGAIWPLLAFGLWLDRIRGRQTELSAPRMAPIANSTPTNAQRRNGLPAGRP